MNQVVVYRRRVTILGVSLGMDVSADTFASEIRVEPDSSSDLLATWNVNFATDGTDGELLLRMDTTEASGVSKDKGYMDIKRISGGDPYPVFDGFLEVLFTNSVTE